MLLKSANHPTLKIVNSEIEGGPAVNGVPQDADALDSTGNVIGLPTGRAFDISDTQNVEISNTEISEFSNGILMSSVDGALISNNEIHHLRTTPLKGADLDNITVDGNNFHTFTPWNLGGAGDHGDFRSFFGQIQRTKMMQAQIFSSPTMCLHRVKAKRC